MSDVVGSASIQIEPDFSDFERKLTRQLEAVVDRAQKSAEVTLKVDDKSTNQVLKGIEKSLDKMNVVMERFNNTAREISRNLQEMSKSMDRVSRSMKNTSQQGTTLLTKVQSIFIILGNTIAIIRFAEGMKGLSQRFAEGRKGAQGFLGQMQALMRAFVDSGGAINKANKAVGEAVKGFTGGIDAFRGLSGEAKKWLGSSKQINKTFGAQAKGSHDASKATRVLLSEMRPGSAEAKNAAGLFQRLTLALGNHAKKVLEVTRVSSVMGVAQRSAAKSAQLLAAGLGAGLNVGGRTVGVVKNLTGGLFGLAGGLRKNKEEVIKTRDGYDKVNDVFVRLAGRIKGTSNSFEKFGVAGRFAQKVIQTLVVDSVRNFDNMAASALRVNKAVGGGGIFGGAKFAFNLSSTIGLVTTLTGVVTAGSAAIIAFAQKASTANESINALGVLLGPEAAPKFKSLIGDPTEIGLSGNKLREAINPLIPLLKNAGLAGDALAESMDDVVRRSVDISSVFNVDVTQSIGAIGAGLRGEIEPLERLGVAFNAAEVEAVALGLGFEKVGGQLPESAKQMARLQVIMEKSNDVQDDFVNTADSVANAQRVLTSKTSDLAGMISMVFYPAAQKLVQVFIKFTEQNGPQMVAFFQAIGPMLMRFAEMVESLAGVATKTGGIFSSLIIPTFRAFADILSLLTPILTAFLTRFLVAKTMIIILESFAGVLALLPPTLFGVSLSVTALSTSVTALLRPLALGLLAMQMFGISTGDASQALLGGFGGALKFIEPLLRIVLFRMLAMKAIPAVIMALNFAMKTLNVNLALAEATAVRTSLTLVRFAGPAAVIVGIVSLLAGKARDTTKAIDGLIASANELETIKFLEKFDKELEKREHKGFAGEFFENFEIQGQDWIAGLFGNSEDDKAKKNAKKVIQEIFALDPAAAKRAVDVAKKQGASYAKAMEKEFTALNKKNVVLEAATKKTEELASATERATAASEAYATAQGDLNSVIGSALQKVEQLKTLDGQIASNRKDVTEATKDVAEAEKEYNKIKNDTARDARELVEAEEAVIGARERLRDLDQERVSLLEQLAELERPATAEELAVADNDLASSRERLRDIDQERVSLLEQLAELERPATQEELTSAANNLSRAQINLNSAIEAEQELLKKAHPLEKISINLAGLSLDQIKNKIAGLRAAAAATDRAEKKKSEIPTEDELLSANLDVQDATIAVTEAKETQDELNNRALLNADGIREINERIVTLDRDKEGIERDINTALGTREKLNNRALGNAEDIREVNERLVTLGTEQAGAQRTLNDLVFNEGELRKGNTTRKEEELTALTTLQTAQGVLNGLVVTGRDLEKERTGFIKDASLSEADRQAKLLEENATIVTQLGLMDGIILRQEEVNRLQGASLDHFMAVNPFLNATPDISTQPKADSKIFESLNTQIGNGNLTQKQILAANLIQNTLLSKASLIESARGTGLFLQPAFIARLAAIDNSIRIMAREAGISIPAARTGMILSSDSPLGTLVRAGERGNPEAIMPLRHEAHAMHILRSAFPYMSMGLQNQLAPALQGSPLEALKSPHSTGYEAPHTPKPTALEIKLDRLIQLQEEGNGKVGISAPISVSSSGDPALAARKVARELKKLHRKINRG